MIVGMEQQFRMRKLRLVFGILVLLFALIFSFELVAGHGFEMLRSPRRFHGFEVDFMTGVLAVLPAVWIFGGWLIVTAPKSMVHSQYSLRTLFVAVTVIAALLAWSTFVFRTDWTD